MNIKSKFLAGISHGDQKSVGQKLARSLSLSLSLKINKKLFDTLLVVNYNNRLVYSVLHVYWSGWV